jgi:hypothetical protein
MVVVSGADELVQILSASAVAACYQNQVSNYCVQAMIAAHVPVFLSAPAFHFFLKAPAW